MSKNRYSWYRHSKYNAKPTSIDGITFDSIKEANVYVQLKMLKNAGEVESFRCQPSYTLLGNFVHAKKKFRGISYIADFEVRFKDKHYEVWDVKGMKTPVYLLKKKLFLSQNPDTIFHEI